MRQELLEQNMNERQRRGRERMKSKTSEEYLWLRNVFTRQEVTRDMQVVGFDVTSLDYKNKGSEFQWEYDNDPLKEIHAFKMQ